MKIISSAFDHNSDIPQKYSCEGEDINPPLRFEDLPEDAKCLALIVSDPDSPSGDFVHWMLWNINPNTIEVLEDSIPPGAIEGTNDFGQIGWGGPCPHSGRHRYEFHLYALSEMLDVPDSVSKEDLRERIQSSLLEESLLTGMYEKKEL